MIAYDKNQSRNHFVSFAVINYNNICISEIIQMCCYVRYYFKHNTLRGSNCNRLVRHLIPWRLLMKNINAEIIFFPVETLIAIRIVFHISYQYAKIKHYITCSNCNRDIFSKTFYSLMIAYVNIMRKLISLHCRN